MSIKQNITSLQNLLEAVNNLPEATTQENLDAEISTQATLLSEQDAKITELAQVLASKASGGSSEPILQDKTVTPSSSSQTIIADSGYDGLDTVTVNAIPNTYVQPSVTKSATTYTPGIANQTIAAGTYCSGEQTIKGDSNLVASNIKSGVSIFGINGSYEGSGGSGGGTSNSTCTVTFNNTELSSNCQINGIIATVVENGTQKGYFYRGNGDMNLTISNIVCGTSITLITYLGYNTPAYAEISGSATFDFSLKIGPYSDWIMGFTAPSVANENCTIYYSYEA